MTLVFCVLVLASALTNFAAALPSAAGVSQNVLDISRTGSHSSNPRKLHGRFLHITDIHPDPFYRQGSDPTGDHPCHAGDGSAGYYGAERTECDSPFSLVNATFDWIKENVIDEIDFVVWTGDSARHDNDEKHPRTNKQVEQLNAYIVAKFDEVFGKPDNRKDRDPTNDFIVPIVPTYGNNDILPHNILQPGPNRWTRKYLTIWRQFVPQEQRHTFARGGWFFTEVIPNRLAVFSLNTLYFFESNGAVDGCDDPNEPGYEHFEWLRIQLEFLRQRKMKAILTGHVPPARAGSKQNWDETCYQKYNLWLRQYRDVIIGNIFGHMNIDHIILQDVRELNYKFKIPGIDDSGLREDGVSISDGFSTKAKSEYLSDLRELWSNLPTPPKGISYDSVNAESIQLQKSNKKKRKQMRKFLKDIGGQYGERFSLSFISPSIVPNFFPSLRIIEYNITGMGHDHPASMPTSSEYTDISNEQELDLQYSSLDLWTEAEDLENDLSLDNDYEIEKKRKKKKKKTKRPKPNFRIPDPPSKTAPPGPGYSPQTLSFISWKQLYANLTKINAAATTELQYLNETSNADSESVFRKHFSFEVEYDTKDDKAYKLKDLTMRSWLGIAEKIGRLKYDPSSVEADDVDDDDDDFDRGCDDTLSEEDEDDGNNPDSESSDDHDDDDVVEETKHKKKKKKKGKKRKGQKLKQNYLWRTFVRRAFVGSLGDEELEDEFG